MTGGSSSLSGFSAGLASTPLPIGYSSAVLSASTFWPSRAGDEREQLLGLVWVRRAGEHAAAGHAHERSRILVAEEVQLVFELFSPDSAWSWYQ